MKLRSVTVEGLRGTRSKLELELDRKSLCLLGENGHGKTTIVDALELWSSGDLKAYHRDGVQLDAAVHVDAGEARIACVVDGYPPLLRTLRGRTPSALLPQGPVDLGQLPPPIPTLRHLTMAAFMAQTAGDKLKGLLDVVGLGKLTDFRAAVVTACNQLRRGAEQDARAVEAEDQVVALETQGTPVIELAERLRVQARLEGPIASVADLANRELVATAVRPEPDRAALVTEVLRAAKQVDVAAVERWNALVADVATVQAGVLEAVIDAGERALQTWPAETCPLCLQGKPRDALATELAERRRELVERTAALRDGHARFVAYREQIDAVGRAIQRLEEEAPPGGWPGEAGLTDARAAITTASVAAREDDRDRVATAAANLEPVFATIDPLRVAADAAASAAQPAQALTRLMRLQDLVRRHAAAEETSVRSASRAASIVAFRDRTDATVREVIEEVIADIGQRTADYYGRLVRSPVYSDVRLVYRDARSGGVEFELTYNASQAVSPPQRVMSESQLNALGLALFLAQLKTHDTQPWRTVVLDDVVNSFDAVGRGAVAQLLTEEFADWQVLLFTHDPVFATHNQRLLASGWVHLEIVAWSPSEGLTITDSRPLEQLRRRLAAGDAASQLGGLARRALEHELARPVEKLRLKLPYQHDPHYSGADFLGALKAAANKNGLSLPVLDRIGGASYFVNFTAHDRSAQGAVSSGELAALVGHLDDLRDALRCDTCGKPIWHLSTSNGRSHQCECRALALSA